MYSSLAQSPEEYLFTFDWYYLVLCPLILFVDLLICRMRGKDLLLPVILLVLGSPIVTYFPWIFGTCFLGAIGWISGRMSSLAESSWSPIFVIFMALPIFLPLWKRSRFYTAVALHRLMQVAAIIWVIAGLCQENVRGESNIMFSFSVLGGTLATAFGIAAIVLAYFLNPVITRIVRARRLKKASRFPFMSFKKRMHYVLSLLYFLLFCTAVFIAEEYARETYRHDRIERLKGDFTKKDVHEMESCERNAAASTRGRQFFMISQKKLVNRGRY